MNQLTRAAVQASHAWLFNTYIELKTRPLAVRNLIADQESSVPGTGEVLHLRFFRVHFSAAEEIYEKVDTLHSNEGLNLEARSCRVYDCEGRRLCALGIDKSTHLAHRRNLAFEQALRAIHCVVSSWRLPQDPTIRFWNRRPNANSLHKLVVIKTAFKD